MEQLGKLNSLWIEGEKRQGRGEAIAIENPANGETIIQLPSASLDDVGHAVERAHQAFTSGIWSKAPRHHRAAVLDKAADLLNEHLPSLTAVEVEQTGRAIREMDAQLPSLSRWFRYYAALLRAFEDAVLPTQGKLHNFTSRVPLGVVALITPFNHPLLIAVKKLAPALAAGNSVVIKPSELAPLSVLLLGPLLKQAGVPDGVFNVLTGEGITTGKSLVSHPLVRKVDITGGTSAGRAIGAIAGNNLAKFTAELGGKAPVVVFKEADVEAAVNGVAFGAFIASGQTCVAATRTIVENSILPQVLEKLVSKAESITRRMGSPKNPDTSIGTLISAKHLQNVMLLVDDALVSGNAKLLSGGSRLLGQSQLDGSEFAKGYFFPPTILTSSADKSILKTRIWREEAFGPVITVVGFNTEEEAIKLANESAFGLGAAVWTRDVSQSFRVSEAIEAGIVWVNTHHRNDPSSPWGAAKTASGVGSENGIDAYHAYTQIKSTIINWASTEEALISEDWFGEKSIRVRYG